MPSERILAEDEPWRFVRPAPLHPGVLTINETAAAGPTRLRPVTSIEAYALNMDCFPPLLLSD